MALVRAAAGDYDTAAGLLDEAEVLYRRGFYPDIRPIHATRARFQIAAGDLGSAAAWARDHGVSVEDDPDYLREYEHLTLVRLLLAQHRAGSSDTASPLSAVLGLLDRLHSSATGAGRDGSTLEILVLRALAHRARGDTPGALAVLRRVQLEAPEPDGHVRLYLDEGRPMCALLHEAVAHDQGARGHLRRVLDRAASRPGGALGPRSAVLGPLSPREAEVLRLLDSELTGPEIARRLYVSLNTLRTHTKRIFTKLDVTNRAAAVRRAHELGLL